MEGVRRVNWNHSCSGRIIFDSPSEPTSIRQALLEAAGEIENFDIVDAKQRETHLQFDYYTRVMRYR